MSSPWQPPPPNGPWGQPLPPAPQAQPQQQGGYPPPPVGYGQPPQQNPYAPQQQPSYPGYPQQPQQHPPPAPGYGQNGPNFAADPMAGLNLTTGDTSSGGERHPYLEGEGDHLLEIEMIFRKETRGNTSRGTKPGNYIVIYEKILATNVPEQHPVGSTRSSWISLDNINMRGINITRLLAALHGVDPASLPKDAPNAPWVDPEQQRQMPWGHYLAKAIDSSNPWKRAQVGVRVRLTDKDFSAHYWAPAQGFEVGPPPVVKPEPAPTQAQAWPPPAQPGQAWPGAAMPQGAPPAQGGYGQPPGAPPAWQPQPGFAQPYPGAPGAPPAPYPGAMPGGAGPYPAPMPQGAPPGFQPPQQQPYPQPQPLQGPAPGQMPPGYGPWGNNGGQQR